MKRLYLPLIALLSASAVSYASMEGDVTTIDKGLRMQSAPKKIRISNYPTLGERKALVLLVEFEDVKFSTVADANEYFDGLLNTPGFQHENGADGSARDYYMASSDGKFLPDFVTVGPIVLPNASAYYGGNTGGWLDEHAHEMIPEACRLIDNEIDFSEFDEDGDGELDNIYVFYAGYAESDTGIGDNIWPQSNMLFTNKGIDLVLDGVRVNHYACSNEIRYDGSANPMPVGIGTFVHEFGHVLGISDHYDSTFAGKRIGVDNWDTMAAANYYNNMHTPPLFSAFERADLGWLKYEELTADLNGQTFTLAPLSDENRAYRVTVPCTDGNEYFVLENRQQQDWDTYLPGHGLLVWHIDMDRDAWINNQVNTDPAHNRVDIIEADGYESVNNLAGDPFPGKRKVTDFDFHGWNGEVVFSLSEISESNGDVSFKVSFPAAGLQDIQGESEECEKYDLTGRKVSSSFNGICIIKLADGTVRKSIAR